MQFQKGNKLGNRFSSENQPERRRQKCPLYKKIKSIVGQAVKVEMTYEDYERVICYLMEQPMDVLKKLTKGEDGKPREDMPVWVVNVISAITTDVRYGRTLTLDSLMDRVFGKAAQPVESEVTVTQTMDLSALTTEELLTYNCLLEKMKAGASKKQNG